MPSWPSRWRQPFGWGSAIVLAIVGVMLVFNHWFGKGVDSPGGWGEHCADPAVDRSRAARWLGPASLELCDGRVIAFVRGSKDPEANCRWLSLAQSKGVPLDARKHRGGWWEVRPAREIPRQASRVRLAPIEYGPADMCELDELK